MVCCCLVLFYYYSGETLKSGIAAFMSFQEISGTTIFTQKILWKIYLVLVETMYTCFL